MAAEKKLHYWFSETMLERKLDGERWPWKTRADGTPERRYRNYCLIDGVEHEFTMASEKPNPDMGNITDLRYLGVGTDSRHVRL
jgi:hypothetical protein